jgi:CRISPR/Cas system-associated exonuclease Cas4 (RecB family)
MGKEIIAKPYHKKESGLDVLGLSSLLEEHYTDSMNRDGFKTKKSFSPSKLTYGHGTCPRYWNMAFRGANFVESDSIDPTSAYNMTIGTEGHERLQALFESAGILEEAEKKVVYDDPPIKGSLDAIIIWNGRHVVEIKTTRQEGFVFRVKTNAPTGYHLVQLLIYMKVEELSSGFILYENRNSGQFLIIPVEMTEENQELVDRVFEWMREVYSSFENDEVIKRPFTKRSKECKGCPINKDCWEAEDGDVVLFPLRIPK